MVDRVCRGFTLIELLIVVAIIGIIAAIAIPSLLRARISANEATAIGDTRTVISAEAVYHAASGGRYGTAQCLLVPSGPGCIPFFPANGPAFIDSMIASGGTKSGYTRSLDETGVVAGGLACYTYHALPAVVGRTGVRSFGGDCSGSLCYSADGLQLPAGPNGSLLMPCEVLR